jgi:hypothetical protein
MPRPWTNTIGGWPAWAAVAKSCACQRQPAASIHCVATVHGPPESLDADVGRPTMGSFAGRSGGRRR